MAEFAADETEMALHVKTLRASFWPYILRIEHAKIPNVPEPGGLWLKTKAFRELWDGKKYSGRFII
jgi:hypothetical protein